VVLTDGSVILLGHASRSPRWDIPKGLAEAGETYREAAARELREETGLFAGLDELAELGVHAYMPGKDLALFAWMPKPLPDPTRLTCASSFAIGGGHELPEFDRFGLFAWEEASTRVGKNLARVLQSIRSRLDPRHSGGVTSEVNPRSRA
jgi:8-oxo-dGTP pyrophosphatase MutT (NUDIX family)